MKDFSFSASKKWWIFLLSGIINSVIYAIFVTIFCFYSRGIGLFLLIIPLVLLVWFLNTTSILKFLISVFIHITTFVFIGIPLGSTIYLYNFERLHPDETPLVGDVVVTMTLYIIMSMIACIVALVSSVEFGKNKEG